MKNNNRLDNKRIQKLLSMPQTIAMNNQVRQMSSQKNNTLFRAQTIDSIGFICVSPKKYEISKKLKTLELLESSHTTRINNNNNNNNNNKSELNLLCKEEISANENSCLTNSLIEPQSEIFNQVQISSSKLVFENISLGVLFSEQGAETIMHQPLPKLLTSALKIDPTYPTRKDSTINSWVRAQLLNFLFRIAKQFNLSRQTNYSCVDYFDRYFSDQDETLSKEELQDLSISVLSLAIKEDGVCQAKLIDVIKYGSKNLTIKKLIQLEIQIFQRLNYNLHAITNLEKIHQIYLGLQQFCLQYRPKCQLIQSQLVRMWFESFVDIKSQQLGLKDELIERTNRLMDVILIDAEYMIYNQSTLCLSLIYITIGLDLAIIQKKDFPLLKKSSRFFLSDCNLNQFFLIYLHEYQLQMEDIIGSLQFICGLFEHIDVLKQYLYINIISNFIFIYPQINEKEFDALKIIKKKIVQQTD